VRLASGESQVQAVADRIAWLRSNGWRVEWSAVESYIDVIAICVSEPAITI